MRQNRGKGHPDSGGWSTPETRAVWLYLANHQARWEGARELLLLDVNGERALKMYVLEQVMQPALGLATDLAVEAVERVDFPEIASVIRATVDVKAVRHLGGVKP